MFQKSSKSIGQWRQLSADVSNNQISKKFCRLLKFRGWRQANGEVVRDTSARVQVTPQGVPVQDAFITIFSGEGYCRRDGDARANVHRVRRNSRDERRRLYKRLLGRKAAGGHFNYLYSYKVTKISDLVNTKPKLNTVVCKTLLLAGPPFDGRCLWTKVCCSPCR